MKLFCALVGKEGSVFSVIVKDDDTVDDLKDAIKTKGQEMIECAASKLKLYLAKRGDEWLKYSDDIVQRLQNGDVSQVQDLLQKQLVPVKEIMTVFTNVLQRDEAIHVLVMLPEQASSASNSPDVRTFKRMKIDEHLNFLDPGNFQRNFVNENEFQLDKMKKGQIRYTPDLHQFWQGYGYFPSFYYIRKEEVMLWRVIKKLHTENKKYGLERPIVIVGSPGVGKSCLLMLIGFYLAFVEKKNVLIIRRLKGKPDWNSVVYFDGQGSFVRSSDFLLPELGVLRRDVRRLDATVLVDGYTQAIIDKEFSLQAFHFLATSCQFDRKSDDSTRRVALPSWRLNDLFDYARKSNWEIDVKLRKNKLSQDYIRRKLVEEQYYYSGGSLRDFCRTRTDLMLAIKDYCSSVSYSQAYELLYTFGGSSSREQVDRVRRHYITDPDKEQHYFDCSFWSIILDSVHASKLLSQRINMVKQSELYTYALSLGNAFLGMAYELIFHSAVKQALLKQTFLELKVRKRSLYEIIKIRDKNFECCGEKRKDCYEILSNLSQKTYWYPDYHSFPFIDAAVVCEAFPKRNTGKDKKQARKKKVQRTITGEKKEEKEEEEKGDMILACIQVTIKDNKKFTLGQFNQLNKALDRNQNFAGIRRVLVVVVPNANACETFQISAPSNPENFSTLISYFDPHELKLEKP